MTLRNSFLARLYENIKRRLWLVVIAVLLFVIAIPIYTAMDISLIEATLENVSIDVMQKNLYDNMTKWFEFGSGITFWAVLFALPAGMQGFSYLYDRSKIDFYHSKPVKASQRFMIIWLNGVLIFALPYLAGCIFNLLLVAASGVLDMALFLTWCEGIILTIGFYFSIYSIIILAVMLTGKPLISVMGVGVFLFYEMAVRALYMSMSSFSFHFFYGYSDDDWLIPWVSPFKIVNLYGSEKIGMVAAFSLLAVFAAAVLALSYWCYKKRPSELAGSAMTFQGIKPFIKIGVAVPVALFAGLATAGLMEYSPLDGTGSPFFPILLGALFLLLACGLIQVIFEADIKGMFHKKREIVISAVLTLAIMLIFRYDVFGYDNRIPALDKIESVSIVTATDQRYSRIFYDENGKQITKEEYTDKYMRLTGEDAKNVRELALLSIEKYQEYPNRKAFNEENEYAPSISYKFRLKNGKTVAREIPVLLRDEENREIIAKIENSEDFIRTNEPAMSDYFLEALKSGDYKVEASWGSEMNEQELTTKEAIQLVHLFREDLLQNSYEARCNELPVGEISIYLNQQISYGRNVRLSVYPSYTNCLSYLKENGFETEEFINIEDIDRITVSKYYETEEPETITTEMAGFSEVVKTTAESMTQTADFTDISDIQTIIDNSYPQCLNYDYWYKESVYDDSSYDITVYFKPDSEYYEKYSSVADFNFLKDQIPDFVLEKLPREAPLE
ncbi:MAG: hypothetical protein J6C63_01510 [Lachnospiraceae bacterium]|nr:hypothetical protein [Lachnospiraceae bacterium]